MHDEYIFLLAIAQIGLLFTALVSQQMYEWSANYTYY